MNKVDLKKELKHLYSASAKTAVEVDVPPLRYLMVDGEGDPNTSRHYAEAVEALFPVAYTTKFMMKKGPQALDYAVMPLPGLARLRVESYTEGRCAQILHVGPFTDEGPTVERLHDFIDARSGRRGKHHEIYLSDIRRAAPAKWKTIIRQPMA